MIINEVYEPKFYNESFGFRPNRNCHQAVREIIEMVQYRKVNYIVEADIKGFFDNVNHEWLIKFLEHDIADKKFIEIVKWAMCKFNRLRGHRRMAEKWVVEVRKREPSLFTHWNNQNGNVIMS